jgi:hypothetical protein
VVARNPFAGRDGVGAARLTVTFLASDPGAGARERVRAIRTEEELRIEGREMFIYYPKGIQRSASPESPDGH